MIKYYYSFIFLLFSFALQAQKISSIPSEKNTSEWEEIILRQEKIGKDTIALKKILQPLQNRNYKKDKVICDLLLANGYALAFDQRTKKVMIIIQNL